MKSFLRGQPSAAGILVLCMLLSHGRVGAHDSPEEVIEELTARMGRQGATADLLFRRATELRVLGRFMQAAGDLEQALQLDPSRIAARAELSRIYLAQGRSAAALASINQALEAVERGADRASFYMVRASIHLARKENEEALADCHLALQGGGGQVDWYLMRSRAQRLVGGLDEVAVGLREGYEVTGAFVLEEEWIEALLDAGHYEEALESIEPHLEVTRWRGSWLLRRARARVGLGEMEAARRDLEDALGEIGRRFNPQQPDLTLLLDRGLARLLLGDRAGAKVDLRLAREGGAEEWLAWRLEWLIERGGFGLAEGGSETTE